MNAKELIKKMEKNGWKHVRTAGSHYIMLNKETNQTLPVPYHGNKDLKPGTLHKLLKQAGLK